MKFTDHFRGTYRIYLKWTKQNRKMSTCNRLDLESLGSWPTIYAHFKNFLGTGLSHTLVVAPVPFQLKCLRAEFGLRNVCKWCPWLYLIVVVIVVPPMWAWGVNCTNFILEIWIPAIGHQPYLDILLLEYNKPGCTRSSSLSSTPTYNVREARWVLGGAPV